MPLVSPVPRHTSELLFHPIQDLTHSMLEFLSLQTQTWRWEMGPRGSVTGGVNQPRLFLEAVR